MSGIGLLTGLVPVAGIVPRRGWQLWSLPELDPQAERHYVAVGPNGEEALLQLSRWSFTPTQARWNWMVDAGLPSAHARRAANGPHPDALVPWGDADIDAAMMTKDAA